MSDLPAIKFDGVYRVLACRFSTPESLEGFPLFRSLMGALPQSRWKEIDLSHFKNPIWDQGTTSACVGMATTAGMQVGRMQSGRSFLEFNPYFVYGLINGGRDNGAMISDGLRALREFGTCVKNALPRGMMYKRQFPQTAFANAKQNRLGQVLRCGNFNEICSAITLGFVCPLGIMVDGNFPRINSEGVSPVASGRGGGGHAILGVGLKKSRRYGWLIKIQNSWGRSFGIKGYSYIHKGHFRFFGPDAFAVQSLVITEGDQ